MDLTKKGREEGTNAGRLMKAEGLTFDIACIRLETSASDFVDRA